MSMKKYLEIMESASKEDYKKEADENQLENYEVDHEFKVEEGEADEIFYVVGKETGHSYASFNSKEEAEKKKEDMNAERKQAVKEDFDLDAELDIDTELDSELELHGGEDGFEPEFDDESFDYEEDFADEEEERLEGEDLMYNYTATIQIHGYDYPLVLHSDSIDDFKVVMKVFRQSGLHPEGEYKWNSRRFTLDDDQDSELAESNSLREGEHDESAEDRNKRVRNMLKKTRLQRSSKKSKQEGGPIEKNLDKDRDIDDKMKDKSKISYMDSDQGRDADYHDGEAKYKKDHKGDHIEKDLEKNRDIKDSEKKKSRKHKKDYKKSDQGEDKGFDKPYKK